MAHLLYKSSYMRKSLSSIDLIALLNSSAFSAHLLPTFQIKRCYANSRGGKGRDGKSYPRTTSLGQTEVFMQSGLKISELPMVVKKVNDVLQIDIASRSKSLPRRSSDGAATIYFPNEESKNLAISRDSKLESNVSEESQEIIAGFKRCFSVGGLFRLLETIPAEEVTPAVAVAALKLIVNLDNHPFSTTIPFHRGSIRGTRKTPPLASLTGKLTTGDTRMSETFLRYAFINMLLEIIYRSRDPVAIIEGKLYIQKLELHLGFF